MTYDILFTASTYKSTMSAIRFANSIKHIDGNHLCILTGPIREEVEEIAKETDAICFVSKTDSLYLGRAWGFVWALNNGINAEYMCSCDDDIEFTNNSKDILTLLNKASEYGFSVAVLCNEAHDYADDKRFLGKTIEGDFVLNLSWVNGDCMFTHWQDNLYYGLPDTVLSSPISYYTEIEYQHRMRAMTNKPLLAVKDKDKYLHHFRTEDTATIRAEQAGTGHVAGLRLWKLKYDLDITSIDKTVLTNAFNVIKNEPVVAKHLMFEESAGWDWGAIYNSLKDNYEVIDG